MTNQSPSPKEPTQLQLFAEKCVDAGLTLEAATGHLEKAIIQESLKRNASRSRPLQIVARGLGVHRNTLTRKMHLLAVPKPTKGTGAGRRERARTA